MKHTIDVHLNGEQAVLADGSYIASFGQAGNYGVYAIQLTLSAAWDGLAIKACFSTADDKCIEVIPDVKNSIAVPAEATKLPTETSHTVVTFVGTQDGMQVVSAALPYVVYSSGCISGQNTAPVTPSVVDQINQLAQEAKNIAQSVRDDADKGNFKGETPKRGVDYWTTEDQKSIIHQTLEALPKWTGGVF